MTRSEANTPQRSLKASSAPESHDGWKTSLTFLFGMANFQGPAVKLPGRLVAGTLGEMEEVVFLKKSFN